MNNIDPQARMMAITLNAFIVGISGYETATNYSDRTLLYFIAFSLTLIYSCYRYFRDKKSSIGTVSK